MQDFVHQQYGYMKPSGWEPQQKARDPKGKPEMKDPSYQDHPPRKPQGPSFKDPSKRKRSPMDPESYLWLVGNGRMVVIVVIIVPIPPFPTNQR